jgi:hypothetical protein
MLKRILLTAALAAFPAAADARDVIQPSTISRAATAAAGATRTLDLSCRAPAIALNATAVDLPAGAEVRRSEPRAGVLGWSLELAAAQSPTAQRLSAAVRCLRLELPTGVTDVSIRAATMRLPSVPVPAGATQRVSLRCERGYIPTGYGLDRAGAPLRLVRAVATARGWSFEFANASAAAADASVSIRCARARVEGRRADAPVSMRLELRRAGFSDAVVAGTALRHSCRAHEFSVATGFDARAVELDSAQPLGARGGLWSFRGGSGRVETQLLCLARDSTFR